MHSLIQQVLGKRQIKQEDMTPEEKETFSKWDAILSSGEITVDSIKKFCDDQLKLIEAQWKDLNNPSQKNERLIILHSVYTTIRDIITKPQAEKENLEKYLHSIISP